MDGTIDGITAEETRKALDLLIHGMITIKDVTGKFKLTLPNGRVIDRKGWGGWEWTHGVGLYGLWKDYEMTASKKTLDIIEGWFADRFAEGGTSKNINTVAPMLTLAYVYEATGNRTYLPWIDAWAEWAMNDLPRTKYGGMAHVTYISGPGNLQQLWDDTLMMTVLPLAKIGLLLNRPHYVEEAKKQCLIHIQYLFDTKTGLFFHGWTFEGNHNFAKALWARGNSWVTIVIPELLELFDLPADDPLRIHLINTFDAQCSALLKYQEPDGLWKTLIDQPISDGSYVESSATAGFAYGLLKGLRKRYITGDEYRESAIKAIKAVLSRINPDGELLDTSNGTGVGVDFESYYRIAITSMPYGQAMAIMALGEFRRLFI